MENKDNNSNNKIQDEVKNFKDALLISSLKIPEQIEELLNMSRADMLAKDKQTLLIDAAILARYAMNLRSEVGKLRARISWCQANIDSIIGREIPNVTGYGYNEKAKQIIRNDTTARKLDQSRMLYQSQLDSIEELDRKVEFFANCIKNIAFIKE